MSDGCCCYTDKKSNNADNSITVGIRDENTDDAKTNEINNDNNDNTINASTTTVSVALLKQVPSISSSPRQGDRTRQTCTRKQVVVVRRLCVVCCYCCLLLLLFFFCVVAVGVAEDGAAAAAGA